MVKKHEKGISTPGVSGHQVVIRKGAGVCWLQIISVKRGGFTDSRPTTKRSQNFESNFTFRGKKKKREGEIPGKGSGGELPGRAAGEDF